jgi:magnesium transporter
LPDGGQRLCVLPAEDQIRMVTAYLFDRTEGTKVDAWAESFRDLTEDHVLWVNLVAPTHEEETAAREVFELSGDSHFVGSNDGPSLDQHAGYLAVTAIAVSDEERDLDREHVAVACFVGPNWVLTVHEAEIAVIDEFREVASGKGELGGLDAPSFLAALLEWVVGSYLRAFDEIEATLEDFDIEALSAPSRDPEAHIKMLIEARQRVGRLRRSLAPHREVFASLSHSEFDPLSSERSSERFVELTNRLDSALASARDVKDAIASSFDVLIVRTEHRTNEIMKVLTIASILLLPGALIAGILGMNVDYSAGSFADSPIFWFTIIGIVLIASVTLALARLRRWI